MTNKHNIEGKGSASAPVEASYVVYFNGVRVPASEVVVSSGPGSPLSARIVLPPHKLLMRMGAEDRVQVAVFYLDSWYAPYRLPTYNLLFEGSITGFEYQTQAGQHTMSFYVRSNLAILADLFIDFMSGSAKKGTAKTDQLYPNQLKIRGRYPAKLFSKKYTGRGDISRPFGLIENVFRAVLGKHQDGTGKNKPTEKELAEEVDSYYDRLEAQRNVWVNNQVDMMILKAAAKNNPMTQAQIDEALSAKSTYAQDRAVTEVFNSLPSQDREVLMGEFTKNQALLVKASQEKLDFKVTPKHVNIHKSTGVVSPWTKLVSMGLVEDLESSSYKILSPDVLLKRQTDLLKKAFSKQVKKKLEERSNISRSITQTGFFSRFMRLTRFVEHWVASPYLEGYPGSTFHPAEQFASMGTGSFPLLKGTNKPKILKALARQSGVKQGKSVWNLVETLFAAMYYQVVEVLAPPMYKTRNFIPYGAADDLVVSQATPAETWAKVYQEADTSLTLASYVTKPDEPFAAPPGCNVLYPSMVRQWSFNEDYASQPTRVYFNRRSHGRKLDLSTKLPGYAHQSSRVGFPGVVGRHAQRASKSTYNDLELLVFPEEYYRGPKPLVSDVPYLMQGILKVDAATRMSNPLIRGKNQAFKRLDPENLALSREAHTAASASGSTSYGLLSDVAKQEYYRTRGQSTTGSAATVFNPYIVAGFPLAIFDSTVDGYHVLANVATVQHTLTPGQCSTSVQFTHVRSYEQMLRHIAAQGVRGTHYGPASPIGEVRDLLQNVQAAAKYYARLLYQPEIGAATLAGREQADKAAVELDSLSRLQEQSRLIVDQIRDAALAGDASRERVERGKLREKQVEVANKNIEIANNHVKLIQEYREAELKITSTSTDPALREEGIWDPSKLLDARNRATVYDYTAYFGWENAPPGKINPICLSDVDPDRVKARFSADSLGVVEVGIPRDYRVRLLVDDPEVKSLMTDTRTALAAVARPVVTLEQYINFYAVAGRGKSDLDPVGRGRGIRVGPRGLDGASVGNITHYDIIRQFIGGPGVEPGSKVSEKLNRSPYDSSLYPPLPKSSKPVEGVEGSADASLAGTPLTVKGLRKALEPLDESIARTDRRRAQFEASQNSEDTTQEPVYLGTIEDGTGAPVVFRVLKPGKIATFGDLPDSRRNWQAILYQYQRYIESKAPQGGGF